MLRSFFLAAILLQSSTFATSFQKLASEPIVEPKDESYEYIVIGSGAGGGTLAARLAMAGKKTLLIEAGEDQGENIHYQVPAFHAYASEDPNMSWNFYVDHYNSTERNTRDSKYTWETADGKKIVGKAGAASGKGKGILYPRTQTLGGCTAHNAMVTIYPHEADWNLIQNITGDTTWNPANMRRLFTKMENLTYSAPSTAGHGTDGFLATMVTDVNIGVGDPKMLSLAFGAANVMNNGSVSDSAVTDFLMGDINSIAPNRDVTEGLFSIPLAIQDGKRSSARDAVLNAYFAKGPDGKKKYPLHIALNTFATKLILDKSGAKPKATGVEVLKGKYLYRASPSNKGDSGTPGKYVAEKEVIVSAGTYNSPQLLKLSGIGPKAELESFKIPVVVDLPGVGTNLQDHMEIGVTHAMPSDFEVVKDCTYGQPNDPCLKQWENKEGVYGQSNGFIFAALKKTSLAHQDKQFGAIPDLFLFGGLAHFRGYYPGYSHDVYGRGNWTWVALKAHTGNTAGTVTLRSADPLDPPVVLFNFYDGGVPEAAARDVTAMVEAVRLARRLTVAGTDGKAQGTARPEGGQVVELLPGLKTETDEQIADYVKDESWSHHASCTNPIGADDDKMAVLDSKFRVRGVDGLRVVDASVFPRIPGFFVAVPVYMVGEKAAESILEGK